MTRSQKWVIRFMWLLQLLAFIAIGSPGLRAIILGGGTAQEALIVFLITCVWEDILKIKFHLRLGDDDA